MPVSFGLTFPGHRGAWSSIHDRDREDDL